MTPIRSLRLSLCLCVLLWAGWPPAAAHAQECTAEYLTGEYPVQSDFAPTISADGRFVAFTSVNQFLVPDDSYGSSDVFVRDRDARTTSRISVSSDGTQANGGSYAASLTPDGRFVAFLSGASNLVAGGSGGPGVHVFLHDRVKGQTEQLSVDVGGLHPDARLTGVQLSADARAAALAWSATVLVNGRYQHIGTGIAVWDRQSGLAQAVGAGLGKPRYVDAEGLLREYPVFSDEGALSGDGRFVAFLSNGVQGESGPTCRVEPAPSARVLCDRWLYVFDRWSGSLEQLGSDFEGKISITPDGRFIAAAVRLPASSLPLATAVGVHDRAQGTRQLITAGFSQELFPQTISRLRRRAPSLSADGRWVAYVSESEHPWSFLAIPERTGEVVVYDRQRGTIELVCKGGVIGATRITPDGGSVAFDYRWARPAGSLGPNPVSLYVYDRVVRSRGPNLYGVFEKDGVELIARLGRPDQVGLIHVPPPEGPPFHGSFWGARFAAIGTENLLALTPDGAPLPNLYFSGSSDAEGISAGALTEAFARLTAPGGFFRSWQELPSDGQETSGLLDSADLRSLSSALGDLAFADTPAPYALAVPVDGQGRRSPVPGFGATERPHQRVYGVPLLVSESGRIERLTTAHPPSASELFGIFSRAGWECIIHLGSHDELATRPLLLWFTDCPRTFAAGVAGVQFALVGVIERDHERPNLLFGAAPSGSTALCEEDVRAAAALLSNPSRSGFIDQLPGLAQGAGAAVELAAADPRSAATRLPRSGPGALPAPVTCTEGDIAASTVLLGAAALPLEQVELLRLDLHASLPGSIRFMVNPQ